MKKWGYLMVAIALVIVIFYFASQMFIEERNVKETNETSGGDIGSSELAPADDEEPERSAGFESLDSIISYDLNSEIQSRLNPISFDSAFVTFLEREGLIITGSGEGAIGIVKASDEGEITINLDDNSWYFTIRLGIRNSPLIYCEVTEDGSYEFDKVIA